MTFVSKTTGCLIAVVGPSGVGKDSVMSGLHSALPDLHLVRRVITRAPDLGGEDYDAVSVAQFEAMVDDGAFALHWGAHGLHYGIPVTVMDHLGKGTDCLVNFSRRALSKAAGIFPRLVVLNITARPETLAQRLAARGRETEEEIGKRLAQADKPLPAGLNVINLANDGPLSQTVARGAELLQPVSL
ncbi:MAG: phosphonate metabolism protein/1,5-bisphosphokinase (PRPP-forming) PhnN [Sulfitobacter geojensis]